MTKQQYIERYGEAKYLAFLANQKARRSTPEAKEAHATYMRSYYASKKEGAVRPIKKRGLNGVVDGTYWEKYAQQEDVKEANRVKAKAAYQALTPEERLEVGSKRRAARRAKLASDAEFAADQGAKELARLHTWRVNHRARVSDYNKPRRALGKMNGEFVRFLRSQPCMDCGTTEKPITIGHLIPVKRGGTNHPCNLVAQCRSCNSKQHAKVHLKFAQVNYPEAARYAVAA